MREIHLHHIVAKVPHHPKLAFNNLHPRILHVLNTFVQSLQVEVIARLDANELEDVGENGVQIALIDIGMVRLRISALAMRSLWNALRSLELNQ